MSATHERPVLGGAILVAAGAALFACKALFAKAIYAQHVPFELTTVMRSLLSIPLFWLLALRREGWARIRSSPPAAAASAAVAGLLCYYVGTLADFYALMFVDASIERVLLFSFPAMVVLFTSLLERRAPSRGALLACALTYAGIFLVMGGFDPVRLRANLLGGGFVLIAALFFAIYFMAASRHTHDLGVMRFSLFAMSAAALAMLIHGLARHAFAGLAALSVPAWGMLLFLAVGCLFLPVLLQAEGVRRIGAQRSAIVSTVGPPTTILLGWIFLGERLTLAQIAGVLVIVGGVLTLDLKGSAGE